jgi:UPF0755 protein
MKYASRPPKRHIVKRLIVVGIAGVVLLVGATIAVRHVYFEQLKPVSSVGGKAQLITVKPGATVDEIAQQLHDAGLIRSTWAFRLYVSSKEVRDELEAGTYSFEPSQSLAEIVSQLTHGKVTTDLVTIIPGQRLDQIHDTFLNYGFSAADVDAALNPATYAGNPALVDKPTDANLEGYIYPDSYQKTGATKPQQIVEAALKEMNGKLSPDLRAAFAQQGLSTYEGIILASVVEQEVPSQKDRAQAAQVFLKRLRIGMALESDATSDYFDSYKNKGLPPHPISNVTNSSLQAVAHPATTDWLYFVSGDDGITRFNRTLQEHETAVEQYCHELCGR